MAKIEIPIFPPWRHGNSPLFFLLLKTIDNPSALIVIKANFFQLFLSSLCVVLLSPPCFMYDSITMGCISRRDGFFPNREKSKLTTCSLHLTQ
jgi:hypothetical protein